MLFYDCAAKADLLVIEDDELAWGGSPLRSLKVDGKIAGGSLFNAADLVGLAVPNFGGVDTVQGGGVMDPEGGVSFDLLGE